MSRTCILNDTYVIIEQIHSKNVLPGLKCGIGPSMVQIVRQIIQNLIGWRRLTTRPTGESQFIRQYVGHQNVVTPLPKIGNLLPEGWTSAHLTPTPTIYHYGHDPIPHVKLYSNPTVNFTMPGGKPPATAIAIYHKATGRLEFPDPTQRERVIRNLVTRS